LRQARLQMVGDAVLRIGRHHAQVLQRGPGAQLQVQLQVLHQGATTGAARFALVQLDEFELRARLQLQHQQGRLDLGARLVAQLQAQRTRAGGDAQAQAAAAERTMRPAERRGVLVTGQRQAGEQLGALARVGGVEPARLEARRAACGPGERLQGPAGALRRRGLAAGGRGHIAQPDLGGRRRQVAEGFRVARDPAAGLQAVAGAQGVGAGEVHVVSTAAGLGAKPVRAMRRAKARSPRSAMQPWSSTSTASGASASIICR
jgi:hypothetical protein